MRRDRLKNMKSDVYRSPVIFVTEGTAVGECIQLMRDHNVSSVLVVGGGKKRDLVGIFTERDFLKTVKHSADGAYFKTAVRQYMSRPVRAIEASKLSEAGELMIKNGFRHLPIYIRDSKGDIQIVGMLSMKDLLLNLMKTGSNFQKALFPKLDKIASNSIAVVTADPYLLRLLEEGFPESANIEVRHLAIEDLMPTKGVEVVTKHLKAVIVDLDNIEPKRWAAMLRNLALTPQALPIIVTFTSGNHSAEQIKTVGDFAKAHGISVFLKPVPVAALFAKIVRMLR